MTDIALVERDRDRDRRLSLDLERELVLPGIDVDRDAIELVGQRLIVETNPSRDELVTGSVLRREDDRWLTGGDRIEALGAVLANRRGARRDGAALERRLRLVQPAGLECDLRLRVRVDAFALGRLGKRGGSNESQGQTNRGEDASTTHDPAIIT